MEKKKVVCVDAWWFSLSLWVLLCLAVSASSRKPVVLDNGIVKITLSNPGGDVIGIKYNGIKNVLSTKLDSDNRGYWDVVFNSPGEDDIFDKLACNNFSVIMSDENQVEVSFTRTWNPSIENKAIAPINVDKRYIVRRGSSGFYTYTILERLEGWPDVDMDQIRVVYKLNEDLFHFMAISDTRQRVMPTYKDRETGQELAYREAVLLTRPSNPELRGEVDDKYQYSCEDKDNKVHGWIAEDEQVGFWMITPSDEFRVGGPIKQDLTSHAGPYVLNMFTSTHYAGKDLDTSYRNGEPWKKVLGPAFVYLNSASSKKGSRTLWEDAKSQMLKETKSWPYEFPQSKDFPKANERGTVEGQLLIRDRYVNDKLMFASNAYVGLAPPGEVGSWQTNAKGYQFWTRADEKGQFVIDKVRPGDYNLYAWVPGFIGDYMYNNKISIEPGSLMKLGYITYQPPRNGPTLWEIGVPDRTAGEFYVPDPYPTLLNRLYTRRNPVDRYRQYGLWQRYTDLYPNEDLIYDVDNSNYARDWFFAHVTRNIGNETYEPTTWQIIFQIPNVNQNGPYTLQLALAAASIAEVQVRFNDKKAEVPHFTTGLIGRDSAIPRHGIHGLYWFYSIEVAASRLVNGKNVIYLTQSRNNGRFNGVMYDYIRLEGPKET